MKTIRAKCRARDSHDEARESLDNRQLILLLLANGLFPLINKKNQEKETGAERGGSEEDGRKEDCNAFLCNENLVILKHVILERGESGFGYARKRIYSVRIR